MKSIEIGDVGRVKDTPRLGREGKLFGIRFPSEASVQGRDNGDTTRTKSRYKITVHRVFVDVDLLDAYPRLVAEDIRAALGLP